MILAIETSTPQASLSLFENGAAVWQNEFVTDRSHNSEIFTPLAEALDICKRQLDLIAIGTGPGSYSGVRVGIAAANGISLALGVPVVGISSLEAYESGESDYLVVGDARRKSFFVATISNGKLDAEPDLMPEDDFQNRLSQANGRPVYTMDQSVADNFESVERRYPTAENIAKRASQCYESFSDIPMKPIEPHYLRPPYITKAKKKPVPGFPK